MSVFYTPFLDNVSQFCKKYRTMHTSYPRRQWLHLLGTSVITAFASPCPAQASEPGEIIYVPQDKGEKWPIGGNAMTLKLSQHQTNGCLSFFTNTLAPGFLGAPPHFHKTFDEICFVVAGTIHVLVGEQVFELHAGDLHVRPRGIMHTFWNAGTEPARCLEISTPGGHEDYLKAMSLLLGKGVSPTPQDFAELQKRHDIVYLPEKLPVIMQKYHVHL